MIYAQLNKENICVGLSQLSGEVEKDGMLQIENYDASLLGKKYNNGIWKEVERESIIPEPTEIEILTKKLDMLGKIILGGGLK